MQKVNENSGNFRIDLNANFLKPFKYVYYEPDKMSYIYFDAVKELCMFSNDEIKSVAKQKQNNMNFKMDFKDFQTSPSIDEILDKLKIKKLDSDNPDILKLEVIPIVENTENQKPENFVFTYYIDTEKWLINKMEVVPENNINNKKPDTLEFQYLKNGFPLKLTLVSDEIKINTKTYSGRVDLIFNYKNSLLSKIIIKYENKEVSDFDFAYNKDNKIDKISFDNTINNTKVFFQVSEIYFNKKYEKSDFVVPAENYSSYGLKDLEQIIKNGEIIAKVLQDDIGQMVGMFLMPPTQMTQMPNSQMNNAQQTQQQAQQQNSSAQKDFEKLTENETPEKPVKKEIKNNEVKQELVNEQREEQIETKQSENYIEGSDKTKTEQKISSAKKSDKLKNKPVKSDDYKIIVQMYNSDNRDPKKLMNKINNYLDENTDDVQILYIAAYINYQNLNNNEKAVDYFKQVLKYADLNDKIEKQLYYWSRRLIKRLSK
jgi:hypothetical protein